MRGSSPRMRGKLHTLQQDPLRNRLIPAHAGKTVFPVELTGLEGAHPRACGEN